MTNSDYIEVRGPKSLAELVAVIDPSPPLPEGDVVTLELGDEEYAAVQFDEADKAFQTTCTRLCGSRRVRKRENR
jgi:hypothetical protein